MICHTIKAEFALEEISSLCKNLEAPLCKSRFRRLEKFSSCDNVPAFPGCCVVQLFASFSQLLYVAATSSSCYGGELMGRPNLGERPHARAGKIWNYFQNLGRWANEKNDKSTDWKKLTFQLEGS